MLCNVSIGHAMPRCIIPFGGDHIEAGDFEDWSAQIIPQLQQEAE